MNRALLAILLAVFLDPGSWTGRAAAQTPDQQVQPPSTTPTNDASQPPADHDPKPAKPADQPQNTLIQKTKDDPTSVLGYIWSGVCALVGMLLGSFIGYWFSMRQYIKTARDTAAFELSILLWNLYFQIGQQRAAFSDIWKEHIGNLNAHAARYAKTATSADRKKFAEAYRQLVGITDILDPLDAFYLMDQDDGDSLCLRVKAVLETLK